MSWLFWLKNSWYIVVVLRYIWYIQFNLWGRGEGYTCIFLNFFNLLMYKVALVNVKEQNVLLPFGPPVQKIGIIFFLIWLGIIHRKRLVHSGTVIINSQVVIFIESLSCLKMSMLTYQNFLSISIITHI